MRVPGICSIVGGDENVLSHAPTGNNVSAGPTGTQVGWLVWMYIYRRLNRLGVVSLGGDLVSLLGEEIPRFQGHHVPPIGLRVEYHF